VEALSRGVIIGVGGVYKNVLRIQPPLVIDEDQATEAVKRAEA